MQGTSISENEEVNHHEAGKSKAEAHLIRRDGIPIKDITIYGRYEYYGNKERLAIGSHTIVATNGRVFISSPVIREDTEDVDYRNREIKVAPTQAGKP